VSEVIERLRPDLRIWRDDVGRELFDVPEAPVPDPGTPVPARFLPEYDNVLFSHANRDRINDQAQRIPLPPGNGGVMGTLLLDGFYRGTWKIARSADRATLRVKPFERLNKAQIEDVSTEGVRLPVSYTHLCSERYKRHPHIAAQRRWVGAKDGVLRCVQPSRADGGR